MLGMGLQRASGLVVPLLPAESFHQTCMSRSLAARDAASRTLRTGGLNAHDGVQPKPSRL
jgi:hypothetical protein